VRLVIFCHVAVTPAEDYATRRAAYREHHLARALELRTRRLMVAGGPAPDGRRVDVFYRVPDLGSLKQLVEEDPYFTGGAWTAYEPRPFSHFLEPWDQPPIASDGSRPVAIVEGHTADVDMASFALIEARGAGRMAFGGFFPGGETLAVMRTADTAEAARWLEETGFWSPGPLTTRPWLYVL
jgi:uncharacterized protein YciI